MENTVSTLVREWQAAPFARFRGIIRGGMALSCLAMMTHVLVAQETVATSESPGAAAPATIGPDSGDTAWILVATALVLFMNIPALALFYGGLVRTKNVLSIFMQCLVLTALMTVLWIAVGYSMAFDETGMEKGKVGLHAFVGGLSKAMLWGVNGNSLKGTIPEALFASFQMTFAIITPALIIGAFAERMRFAAVLLFSSLWLLLVYVPVCHMTWGGPGGYFADWGVFDFAGGIVVHVTAGFAALVACILIGPRLGFPNQLTPPHNMTMTAMGTAMLWVGWYGFNAGSALHADGSAAMALLVTHLSASVATLTWMAIEWIKLGKPSVLGAATGSIAGLASITPASGYVGPLGALVIGLTSAIVCFLFATTIKRKFKYDDSLDVFGVHGVGGFLGSILVAVFAHSMFGGNQADLDITRQLGVQFAAAMITAVYTMIVTFVILKVIQLFMEIRVRPLTEQRGLDLGEHEERGYNLS